MDFGIFVKIFQNNLTTGLYLLRLITTSSVASYRVFQHHGDYQIHGSINLLYYFIKCCSYYTFIIFN